MRRLLLGVAATALMTTGALAADLFTAPSPLPSFTQPAGFDWEGAYGGGFVGGTTFPAGIVGGAVGYNFYLTDNIVGGFELNSQIGFGGGFYSTVTARGRVGVTTGDALIYVLGGVGTYNFSMPIYEVGTGVEFAVSDNMSLRGELTGWNSFGAPPFIVSATVGAFWHF